VIGRPHVPGRQPAPGRPPTSGPRPPRRRARGLRRTAMLGVILGAALLATAVSIHLALRSRGGPAPPPDLEPPETPSVAYHPPADLLARGLAFPVQGIATTGLVDTFAAARGTSRVHNAMDIMAPRGTPVVAVDAGTVSQLGNGGAGGITVYEVDDAGRYAFYYAHLDRIAPGLAAGQTVKRGDLLGYVGTTGNAPANAPHLHFAIYEIADTHARWGGRPINPFPLWKRPAG
jgi:peptidoglycan LD-endopeptidase LytH